MGSSVSCANNQESHDIKIRERTNTSSTRIIDFSKPEKVIAIFNFTAADSEEMSFMRGEELETVVEDQMDQYWWLARKKNKRYGLIPRNMVVPDTNYGQDVYDSWYNMDKLEANLKLTFSGVRDGTYIIRPCSDKKNLVLSMCCTHGGVKSTKHFKIYFDNKHYYVKTAKRFINLAALVKYYTEEIPLHCCNLTGTLAVHQEYVGYETANVEVNRKNLTLGERIGQGHSGEVFQALLDGTIKVAVKRLSGQEGSRHMFMREIKCMHQMNHRCIVKLIGVCTKPSNQPMLIITELMSNGSLDKFLIEKKRSSNFGYLDLCTILKQICEGMVYLESKSFLHMDLRAANILIGSDLSVKVADFGLSKILEDIYLSASTYEFPIRWMPIEYLQEHKFNIRSDVWSFGIVMYEVITFGGMPYPGLSNREIKEFLISGQVMNKPSECPDEYYNMMLECWKHHKMRPSFKTLFQQLTQWIHSNE